MPPNGHNTDESVALIFVTMLAGDVSLDAEIEKLGAKTENGYIVGKQYNGKFNKMISKIEHFDGSSGG